MNEALSSIDRSGQEEIRNLPEDENGGVRWSAK